MAPDHALGQAELLADSADLVLEEQPQGLDELHAHVCGQPTHVVMRLDLGGDTDLAARLDHVRVQRPLDEEADVAELAGLFLEDADELLADDLPLLLRVGHAGEPGEEALLRLDVDERHVEVAAERLHDLLGLVLAQQPVIDEDAGQLVADRLVDEQAPRPRSRPRPRGRRSPARCPTWARIRSTCSSITAAGVHAGAAPATS